MKAAEPGSPNFRASRFLQGVKSGAQHPAHPTFWDQSNSNFWKEGAGSPPSSSKGPWALTLFPGSTGFGDTQCQQGLGPLSCGCTVLGSSSHSFNRALGSTLLSLVLHHLEALPVLSWDPTSPSFGGISPFLLREQVVTPCLRNW